VAYIGVHGFTHKQYSADIFSVVVED